MSNEGEGMSDTTESRHFVSYGRVEIIRTLIIGALVGIIVWGLAWLLNAWVFHPLMCSTDVVAKCNISSDYAAIAAQIIAAVVGLIALVRQRIFRPLLIVIAVTLTLWGMIGDMSGWVWYGALIASIVTYALAYAVYMLLARIRMLLLSVVAMVVLFVITRLMLNS